VNIRTNEDILIRKSLQKTVEIPEIVNIYFLHRAM